MEQVVPVKSSERYVILDVLRGLALLGIALANYPEFSLYTFQSPSAIAQMSTSSVDYLLRWFLLVFVDGKFYTLFSLLFGIGFFMIMNNAARKGNSGMLIFYRRMILLMIIGFLHLMFIWSGDILMLYALLGMLLPLFWRMSNRGLLVCAGILLVFPIVVDGMASLAQIRLAEPAVRQQWYYCSLYGITEQNFGYWLRDASTYEKVFQFLIQGAWVRVQEFVDGNRYFKVLGLFLIGFYIGRNRLYACLDQWQDKLRLVVRYGVLVGLPLSVLYAWSGMNNHPWGTVGHTVIYTASVYLMGLTYLCGVCLLYLKWKDLKCWRYLATPGRMALTNYISQSVIGMFLFYGIGLGWGAQIGLCYTELIVLFVYGSQMVASRLWLTLFQFGPLEWIWRMLTYGRWFHLVNQQKNSSP